jgi:geranylgeranyl diphosphate synthase type I
MQALRDWSAPLGVAFQLRDDLLGTFGTAQQTGKPGDDLRHGKHNAVVAAFRRLGPSEAENAALDAVWGRADASDDEVRAATEVLDAAKSQVEERLAFLADRARSALAASPFDAGARRMLQEVTNRLTDRGS